MTKYVVELTLASTVATGGTFTVAYPEGTSRGSFLGGKEHKLIVNQTLFEAPEDFTVAFTTVATITYNGTTPLAAGSAVSVELDAKGAETIDGVAASVTKVQPVLINLGSPATADADGYFASQDLTSAGVASVSTTAAAAIAAAALGGTADVPRNVVAAWTGAAVITITGTDAYGNTIVEKSASGTSLTGKKAFKTVTNIGVSANVTSLTVGTGVVVGLPVYVGDQRQLVAEVVEGTIANRPGADYVQIPFQITEAEADAGGSFWIYPGFAGSVVDIGSVVENTVTTGGSITVEIGGTAVDGLALVIADGSAAGDVDYDAATADHATTVFTSAQALEIVVPSAVNASAPINGFIGVKRTASVNGTFVAGLSPLTKSSATTADVRGTYTPTFTPDGSKSIQLFALVEDPTFLGNPQYAG